MGNASTSAKHKYNRNNYDYIGLYLPKGYKDRIRKYAELLGLSVNSFIKSSIDSQLEAGQNSCFPDDPEEK